MFMLVSRRYERASLIVTSNKPFSAWGEIFGDDATAAALIDRLVHHAEILSLKGDSYRLKDHDLGARPETPRNRLTDHPRHHRRGPQNAPERADPEHRSPKTTQTAPRGADGAGGSSLCSALRASLREPPPHQTRGVNSQPALRGQLSTGLDSEQRPGGGDARILVERSSQQVPAPRVGRC